MKLGFSELSEKLKAAEFWGVGLFDGSEDITKVEQERRLYLRVSWIISFGCEPKT